MFAQNQPVDREPYAAGRFYASDSETLRKDLASLFSTAVKPGKDLPVRAIIVPHAGYVFSGKTAASAFSAISPAAEYSNIFIIGSSHVAAFDGVSVYGSGDFITPLGKVKVNTEISQKLKELKLFRFPESVQAREHSIEVQLPFIQYYFRKVPPVVPIVIGTDDPEKIKEIAAALKPYFRQENLFIISSDFSHYPPYRDAVIIDDLTAGSIVSKNPATFLETLGANSRKNINGLATSMCGWTSGLALIYLSMDDPKLEFRKIDYTNSGDSKYGDREGVVGYNAIVLYENKSPKGEKAHDDSEVKFTADEIDQLFSIAKGSIKSKFSTGRHQVVDASKISPALKKNMGAFVTLKIDGMLRGCIGQFTADKPLFEVVNDMAYESAFSDGRFDPLTQGEFQKVEIEISVLGPLKKINDISEIIPGRHGIYIKKDFRSGTMLPQVLTENHWTLEQFLGYTSREKAGLGWDGWKNADLYIYEAVVLEERKK